MLTSITTPRTVHDRATRPGQVVRAYPHASQVTGRAAAGTKHIERLTLSGLAAGVLLTVTISAPSKGKTATVTYTTGTTTVGTERAGLLAAIRDSGAAGDIVTAADYSTGSIDLTATEAGVDLVVAVSGTGLATATNTAAAAAATFHHGRAYVPTAWASDDGLEVPTVGSPGALAGASIEVVATHDAAGDYVVATQYVDPVSGAVRFVSATFTHGADVDATGALGVAALEAAIPGSSAASVSGGGDATITWDLPVGYTPITGSTSASATGGSAACTAEPTSMGDDVPVDAWICLSGVDDAVDDSEDPPTSTRGDRGPVFLIGGAHVTTTTLDAPAFGGALWVESTPGATEGVIYATPSPSRYPLPGGRGVSTTPNLSTLAIVAKEPAR